MCTATNEVIDSSRERGKGVRGAIEANRSKQIAGEVCLGRWIYFLFKIYVFARTRQQLVSLRGDVVLVIRLVRVRVLSYDVNDRWCVNLFRLFSWFS